jgi:hypothetical protein
MRLQRRFLPQRRRHAAQREEEDFRILRRQAFMLDAIFLEQKVGWNNDECLASKMGS